MLSSHMTPILEVTTKIRLKHNVGMKKSSRKFLVKKTQARKSCAKASSSSKSCEKNEYVHAFSPPEKLWHEIATEKGSFTPAEALPTQKLDSPRRCECELHKVGVKKYGRNIGGGGANRDISDEIGIAKKLGLVFT